MIWLVPPVSPAMLVFSLFVVFSAGVVRGFAGFGFSAVTLAGLSLVVSPVLVVPAIFMLEVLASLSQLRGISRDIDWSWLKWLALGNLLFIPLGIALLAWLPETPLRLLISALLMTAAIFLRTGHRFEIQVTPTVQFTAGLASGFISGVAAIGGISLAALLSATKMAPATLRATLIVLLLFSDLVSLASAALMPTSSAATTALLSMNTLKWAAWLTPGMLAGIWFGQRHFKHVAPEIFRRYVLNLLIVLATVSALRALFSLLA